MLWSLNEPSAAARGNMYHQCSLMRKPRRVVNVELFHSGVPYRMMFKEPDLWPPDVNTYPGEAFLVNVSAVVSSSFFIMTYLLSLI